MTLLTPPHTTSPENLHQLSAADEVAVFVVASSSSARRPSFSLALPDAKRPRSSLAHRRPSFSSSGVPPAPVLDAPHGGHCPTPILTPEEAASVPLDGMSLELAARPAAPLRAVTLPQQFSSGTGFIRRDDLTARAIAKAQAMQAPSIASALASVQQQQQQMAASEKDRFVNGLVGASVLAIESIWGSASSSSTCPAASPAAAAASANPSSSSVLPLHWFVKEVLRRSRTSCSTLQLALYYLHKSRREIREAVARAEASKGEIVRLERELKAVKAQAGVASSRPAPFSMEEAGYAYPSPPHSPSADNPAPSSSPTTAAELTASVSHLGQRFTALLEAQNSPVLCGRRMFLAALISASKYLQDRNYSNRAWAKISGLEVREVNRNERAFLRLCGFSLHLKAEDFARWTDRLSTLTSPSSSSTGASPSAPALAPSTGPSLAPAALHISPSLLARHGLARSSSEYVQPAAGVEGGSFLARRPSVSAGGRATLNRGASLPTFATTATSAREKGFPIAQSRNSLMELSVSPLSASAEDAAAVHSPSASSSASSSDEEAVPCYGGRKLRALPTRAMLGAAGGVPATWGAGGVAGVGGPMVVDGRGFAMEGVRAH
ncbi:hypothetical protein JCM11251_005521 [Rhodosporidiobolus azoricus]